MLGMELALLLWSEKAVYEPRDDAWVGLDWNPPLSDSAHKTCATQRVYPEPVHAEMRITLNQTLSIVFKYS